jgi:hypothetical protein
VFNQVVSKEKRLLVAHRRDRFPKAAIVLSSLCGFLLAGYWQCAQPGTEFYDHQLIVRSLLDPWVSSSGTRGYRQMMGAESYYLPQAHFLIRDYLQPMSKVRLDLQSGNDC